MMISPLIFIFLFFTQILSVFSQDESEEPWKCVFEGTCIEDNYINLGPAPVDSRLSFTLWLPQRNFGDICPSLLESVANPCSDKYGDYYSFDEIKELIYDQGAINQVTNFFLNYDDEIEHCELVPSPNGDYIKVNLSVNLVNQIFSTTVYLWQSVKTGEIFEGAATYTIPPELQLIKYGGVSPPPSPTPSPPSTSDPPVSGAAKKRALLDDVELSVDEILEYYNLPDNLENHGEKGTQCVFATLGQSYMPSDLALFQTEYGISNNPVKNTTGPNNFQICESGKDYYCLEGNLDVQAINTIAQKAETWYWSIPFNPFQSPFLRFVEELAAERNAPQVNSISYANGERQVPDGEKSLFNDEVCKLGLRGITVIVSSGDFGAPGIEGCKSEEKNCTINPMFPASCPYVTSVGATMGPENGLEEVAAIYPKSVITSGGGFSTYFPRPNWQYKAVKKWLNSNYNDIVDPQQNFRGYPDVSFLGNKYAIYINGKKVRVSGTSASAPTFASLITLANSLRNATGKPPLGFLNFLLYNQLLKHSYNDITEGTNDCCADVPPHNFCCPGQGYQAAPGWDPVTGLGTLDISSFLDVVLSDMTPEHHDNL